MRYENHYKFNNQDIVVEIEDDEFGCEFRMLIDGEWSSWSGGTNPNIILEHKGYFLTYRKGLPKFIPFKLVEADFVKMSK